MYKYAVNNFDDSTKALAFDISKDQLLQLFKDLHALVLPEVSFNEVKFHKPAQKESLEQIIKRQKTSLTDVLKSKLTTSSIWMIPGLPLPHLLLPCMKTESFSTP